MNQSPTDAWPCEFLEMATWLTEPYTAKRDRTYPEFLSHKIIEGAPTCHDVAATFGRVQGDAGLAFEGFECFCFDERDLSTRAWLGGVGSDASGVTVTLETLTYEGAYRVDLHHAGRALRGDVDSDDCPFL